MWAANLEGPKAVQGLAPTDRQIDKLADAVVESDLSHNADFAAVIFRQNALAHYDSLFDVRYSLALQIQSCISTIV